MPAHEAPEAVRAMTSAIAARTADRRPRVPDVAGAILSVLLTSGLGFALSMLAAVIVARALGVEGRGLFAAVVAAPTALAYLAELGLPAALPIVLRSREEAARSGAAAAERVATLAAARTFGLLAAAGATGLYLAGLALLTPFGGDARLAAGAMALFVPANVALRSALAVLQRDERWRLFNVVRTVQLGGWLLAVAAFAATGTLNVGTAAAGMAASTGAAAVLALAVTLSRPAWGSPGVAFRALGGRGLRAHLGNVSPIDALRVDQLLGALLLTHAELGLYAAAFTVVLANRLIGVSLGTVAFPVLLRQSTEARRRSVALRMLAATFVLALVPVVLEVALAGWVVRLLFGDDFGEAADVLRLLALASVVLNLRQVLADVLRGERRAGIASLGEGVTFLVFITLAVPLSTYGATGLAAALLAAALLAFAGTFAAWLHGGER